MHNAYDELKSAGQRALEVMALASPKNEGEAAKKLRKALSVDCWTSVSPETMPEDRIRVIASFGTCVIDDCYYGWASRWKSETDKKKLWRETHSERPLAHVPTSWMAMHRSPAPPASGRTSPVLVQLTEDEPRDEGVCELCKQHMDIPADCEATDMCHQCVQGEMARITDSLAQGGTTPAAR